MPIVIYILLGIFILLATRRLLPWRLRIWQIMVGGCILVLVTRQISLFDAFKAINFNIIFYLFGVFMIGEALEQSGYLSYLGYRLFRHARNGSQMIFMILFAMSFSTMILMNDTIAIIGTPLLLFLARNHKIDPKPLLMILAYTVTISSVMSPIGNPQNLWVAVQAHVAQPFVTFFRYLALPSIANLVLVYFLMRLFYPRMFKIKCQVFPPTTILDPRLAKLSKYSLLLLVVLILLKIISQFTPWPIHIQFSVVALVAALPIFLFSQKRFRVIKKTDWKTLLYFVALFIVMKSAWNSGFFQSLLNTTTFNLLHVPSILIVSTLLSQLLSNLPAVVLYMPMLIHHHADIHHLLALTAGATVSGNLLIMGAVSNVIIVQTIEKHNAEPFGFLQFAKVGFPLTIMNLFVYWVYLPK